MIHQTHLKVTTTGKSLNLITDQIVSQLGGLLDIECGLLHIFLKHTSASLLIQENADPTARHDLEKFFETLVPENQSWMTHTQEGADDSPSHIRSALTQPALTIPIANGKLDLGTWQGIYLFEHRDQSHVRNLTLTVYH